MYVALHSVKQESIAITEKKLTKSFNNLMVTVAFSSLFNKIPQTTRHFLLSSKTFILEFVFAVSETLFSLLVTISLFTYYAAAFPTTLSLQSIRISRPFLFGSIFPHNEPNTLIVLDTTLTKAINLYAVVLNT